MKKFFYRLTAITLLVFFPILALTDYFEGQIPMPAPGNAFLSDPGDPEGSNTTADIQKPSHFLRPGFAGSFFPAVPSFFLMKGFNSLFQAVIPPLAIRAPPVSRLV